MGCFPRLPLVNRMSAYGAKRTLGLVSPAARIFPRVDWDRGAEAGLSEKV
jgi:hypothetical protein